MLRIRLRRTGKKKQPYYRVVVADQRAPRDGDFVEVIGHYNPRTVPETLVVDRARYDHWVSVGARPSATMRTLVARMPAPEAVAEPAAEAAAEPAEQPAS